MKHAGIVLAVIVGACAGGFLLSELIGIIGYVGFGQVVGIKYLPIILSIVCGALAVLYVSKRASRNK